MVDAAQDSVLDPKLAAACRTRVERIRAMLPENGIDALIVSAANDIRYLTGFSGHDSLVVLTDGSMVILTDPRFEEELGPWADCDWCKVVMGVRHRLPIAAESICERRGVRRVGLQAEHVTLAQHQQFVDVFKGRSIIQTMGLVGRLRMLKDSLEIACIEQAIAIQQRALGAALNELTIGMSEIEFCALLEYKVKSLGGEGPSFGYIIGAGANSSIIHHVPGTTVIEEGTLLVDWGTIHQGYCSDMTRTFGVGHMPKKIEEIYAIVLEAQLAAIEAIRPGRTCAEIDAVARQFITRAGYGDRFGHGLGHGLGINVHEEPFFNDLSSDVTLEPGMVMTVEPGIYLPGVGGVRIEDDVLVTDDGSRALSNWPKDLDDAIVETVGSVVR